MAKAITVCQPWAWAIIHGPKRVENRRWYTSYRGLLLIHTGKSRDWLFKGPRDWSSLYGIEFPNDEDLVFGAVIGSVDLVACVSVQDARSGRLAKQWPWLAEHPFVEGPWCFVLQNPEPSPAYFCRGELGLWDTVRPRPTPGDGTSGVTRLYP